MKSLESLVGQMLMFGFQETEISERLVRLFRETRAGGVILFRRNFSSTKALKQLLDQLQQELGRPLLVAVDHEGGRVIHLAGGVTVFPDNLVLGAAGKEAYARQQGLLEAFELGELGIHLNLAPTLDVLTPAFSPNIGIRSYGRDPALVARLGAARIRGIQEGGLSACAKHFPGQGHSPVDAHLGLPVLESSPEEMNRIHLLPFREAIKAGVLSIMTSHPVYPGLDEEGVPATFSSRIVRDLLRGQLGFQDAVLTDDLEMGALRAFGSVAEASVRAACAGHDLLLICSNEKDQRETFDSLLKACRSGVLDAGELERSSERIHRLRRPPAIRKEAECSPAQAQLLANRIAREGIRSAAGLGIQKEPQKDPVKLSAPVVIFPRLSELGSKFFIEKIFEDEQAYVRKLFETKDVRPADIFVLGLEPEPSGMKSALAAASEADCVICFCYDANLSKGWAHVLTTLEKASRDPRFIFLRDPYDADLLKEGNTPYVQAFGFRACQIEAAFEVLLEKDFMRLPLRPAHGRAPQ